MLRSYCLYSVVAVLFAVFLFYSPQLDQMVAQMPFDQISNSFYGETHFWCMLVYFLVPCITTMLIIVPVAILIFKRKISNPAIAKRFAIIVLVALTVGPGLIVNVIFKDNWGRPRPYQVLRDHQTFVSVWQPNFHAPENNSFCGGHASIGFFLGVPFLALGRRKKALFFGVAGGAVIGLVRILQGGHYLSDIVFAGVFVWLSAELTIYMVDHLSCWKIKKEYR